MSAKEGVGYYEFKKHKPWFNGRCSPLLDKGNKINLSGYRIHTK
jgi:hypothetical protein